VGFAVKLARIACAIVGLLGVTGCALVAGLEDRSLEDAGYAGATGVDAGNDGTTRSPGNADATSTMDTTATDTLVSARSDATTRDSEAGPHGPDAPAPDAAEAGGGATDAADASLDGWLGPVAVSQAAPGNMPALCQGTGAVLGYAGLGSGKWFCTPCSCEPGGCGPTRALFYRDTSCDSGAVANVFNPGQCVPVDGGSVSFASTPLLSACPADGGQLSGAAEWTTEGVACPLDQAGCDGSTCVGSGFNDGICVYQDGDVASCPSGYERGRFVFYGSATPPTCTACTCSPETCAPEVYGHTEPACQSNGPPPLLDASCTNLSPLVSLTVTTPIASCAPSGGQLSGTPTPENPRTFCCQ
jgi:hypothetical protein